jgi:hypothetical protein
VGKVVAQTNNDVLAKIAILPSVLFLCFLGLGLLRRRDGYRQIELARGVAND